MSRILKVHDILSINDMFFKMFGGCRDVWEEEISDLDIGPDELKHIFKLADALWEHNGNMSREHALLTSGKHSDGFVDTLRVLIHTPICHLLGYLLADAVCQAHEESEVRWVIGSDHAGAAISHSVALEFGAMYDFCEKGPDKTQQWKRFKIGPEEVVLQVEELITTAGTLEAVRRGITEFHPDYPIKFAPVVATVVNRSGLTEVFDGIPIVSLLKLDINTWTPEECPLCQAGSEAIRPKENWARLTE